MLDNFCDKLNQDGYVVLESFFSKDECKEMIEAGYKLTEEQLDSQYRAIFSTTGPDEQYHRDEYFITSNDKVRCFFEKDALNPDGTLKVDNRIAVNKVGHALHQLNPIFRKYSYCERVKEVCRQLKYVEPTIVQSMYIYKNPRIGGEVIAHQDASYLYSEPIPAIGLWFALEDANILNGCLWAVKGSHKSGVLKRLIRNPDVSSNRPLIYTSNAEYEEDNFIPLPVKAGTCVLLHSHVVHKSEHNHSDKSRHAYTFHIVEKHNNNYSEQNWIIEGPNAPHVSVYDVTV